MLNIPTDTLPPALVAAALAWAGSHHFVVAPVMAERIVAADHLPVCEDNVRAMIASAGETRLKDVPPPRIDGQAELAMRQIEIWRNAPILQSMREMAGPMAEAFGIDQAAGYAMQRYADTKRRAQETYTATLARVKAETAAELGAAGDRCACLGEKAIDDTRTEWAVFSGSLGLVELAPLPGFTARMAELRRAGLCVGALPSEPTQELSR
jgi:hypothetical protein